MPAEQAGPASSETEANATATAGAAADEGSQQANAQTPEQGGNAEDTGTSVADLAEHLNLPADVRDALKSKSEKRSTEGKTRREPAKPTETATETGTETEVEEAGDTPASTEEADGEGEGGDAADTAAATGEAGKKQPKAPKHWPPEVQAEFEKRVGKIWKQKSSAENRAEEAEQLAGQFQHELNAYNAQAAEAALSAPPSQGALGQATNERQLDAMVANAEAVIELVDANPDGIETGEGDKAKFHDPAALAKWKRESEKVLRGAEGRRQQMRDFVQARKDCDEASKRDFPELFDRTTPEYQTAVAIANRYPWIRGTPEANYALGVMVQGFKALEAKSKNGSNGTKADPDLDHRLTPEYQRDHIPPTAAAIPKPPGRSAPAVGKGVDLAMQDVISEGGTVESIGRAYAAMRDARKQTNSPRNAVAV